MAETVNGSKTAPTEGSQSPISHSICGILGLESEPEREEAKLDETQVVGQDQHSVITNQEDRETTCQKQQLGKGYSCVY